jgi:AraC-like DNA-binding protein
MEAESRGRAVNGVGEGGGDTVRAELAEAVASVAARLAAEPGRLVRARSVGLHRRWPRAHFHPTPELFMQTGGATRFEGPDQRWELSAGEAGLMPRGVPHAETPVDYQTPYQMVVACQSRTGFTLIRAHAPLDAEGRRRITPKAVAAVTSERGREAFRYLDEAEQAWATNDRQGAGELAVDLVRVFLRVLAEEARRVDPRQRRFSPVVEAARAVVRSHLADSRLSVDWLAEAAGCSPDHLARRFRAETGNSVVSWITEERVALAQRLLTEGKYQVAEVAWACGFAQPSYFIRVFRERTRLTPLAWRRARAATTVASGAARAG